MTESGLVELVPIDSLNPDPSNPRVMPPSGMAALVRSIGEFGFTNPILTDGADGIIAGHGRVLAALKLGMAKIYRASSSGI